MAFRSVRSRLAQLFGFGQRAKSVIPATRAQAYYRSYEGGVMGNLTQAIERKQPVTFFYKDKWQPEGTPGALGQRVGNPHAVWRGTNGRVYLHLYVDPQSATATGGLPGLANLPRQSHPRGERARAWRDLLGAACRVRNGARLESVLVSPGRATNQAHPVRTHVT